MFGDIIRFILTIVGFAVVITLLFWLKYRQATKVTITKSRPRPPTVQPPEDLDG